MKDVEYLADYILRELEKEKAPNEEDVNEFYSLAIRLTKQEIESSPSLARLYAFLYDVCEDENDNFRLGDFFAYYDILKIYRILGHTITRKPDELLATKFAEYLDYNQNEVICNKLEDCVLNLPALFPEFNFDEIRDDYELNCFVKEKLEEVVDELDYFNTAKLIHPERSYKREIYQLEEKLDLLKEIYKLLNTSKSVDTLF